MTDAVTDLEEDEKGVIWLSKRGGIASLEPETGQANTYSLSTFSQKHLWFWNIELDTSGKIWATTQDGLIHLNFSNNHFSMFPWEDFQLEGNWWHPLETFDNAVHLCGWPGRNGTG